MLQMCHHRCCDLGIGERKLPLLATVTGEETNSPTSFLPRYYSTAYKALIPWHTQLAPSRLTSSS